MSATKTAMLARGLLEAARTEAPGAARRDRIWASVLAAPELAIAAGSAATAAATTKAGVGAGLSAGKLLLLGALAGSVLTAAVGALVVAQSHPKTAPRVGEPSGLAEARAVAAVARVPEVAPPPHVLPQVEPAPTVASEGAPAQAAPTPATKPRAAGASPRVAKVPPPASPADELMREAELVGEARAALVSGDPAAAIDLIDAASKAGARSLEPEELSLRARALRAQGKTAEADAAEQTLRARFPGSFLAR